MRLSISTVAIFLASLFLNQAVAAPHKECTPGKIWADDTDCHAFYQCEEPGKKVRQYCGMGTAFNRKTQTCDTQGNVCH
ncbi:hypothetical protein ARAM_004975 [Aspergillus rambellii]|uniref:Chitin-binding type-2 domain-containing protein n=3 Tax=Aspergillus subgen. Nidulantes TaxID=2720870 RepID=A0A0F8W4V4_9EURO|nr:hypothetical protein ARAM_004975 [Aspergillus rambellii]KKK19023.1 hypothetical protein AOCH_005813 [Aspergillus ochraceoroseus]